ncbi:hypothetical protein KCP78_11515 [Salmonella enterica subsp. enterica]|nr:hypothetical protein KCP78_11515 [Salmonella enterica subsp. enterica]
MANGLNFPGSSPLSIAPMFTDVVQRKRDQDSSGVDSGGMMLAGQHRSRLQ